LQQETAEINGTDWRDNASVRAAEQKIFESAPWDATMTKVGDSVGGATDDGN